MPGAEGSVGLRVEPESDLVVVIWPDGWTTAVDGIGRVVVDGTGHVVAHTGHHVTIGGGFISETPGARRWLGCGSVTIVRP